VTTGGESERFEIAVRYPSQRLARQAVENLTIHGIGALNEMVEGETDDEARFAVLVVPADVERARELLGVAAPAAADAPSPRQGWSTVSVLIIFAAAMIIVPLLAFFISYKLFGG